MHDSTRLAKKGIPSVTIVWDTFEVPARTQARIFGVPDIPLLVIPHQEPGEGEADLRRRAEAYADDVLALLTGSLIPLAKPSR
jgi:hypothetical protein